MDRHRRHHHHPHRRRHHLRRKESSLVDKLLFDDRNPHCMEEALEVVRVSVAVVAQACLLGMESESNLSRNCALPPF